MAKNDDAWGVRYLIHQTIRAGKTEEDALEEVLPTRDAKGKRINKNRSRTVQRWKDRGLWPISEDELRANGISLETSGMEETPQASECSGCSERSELAEHAEPSPDESAWGERVKEIAEEVCREMMLNVQNELNDLKALVSGVPSIPTVQSIEDRPKEPIATGRSEDRIYGKIGATLDAVLIKRLNQEAKEQKMSVGKLLDIILWQRYDRPPLSYELPEEEQTALRAEFPKTRRSKGRPEEQAVDD